MRVIKLTTFNTLFNLTIGVLWTIIIGVVTFTYFVVAPMQETVDALKNSQKHKFEKSLIWSIIDQTYSKELDQATLQPIKTSLVVDINYSLEFQLEETVFDSIKLFFKEATSGALRFTEGYRSVALEGGVREFIGQKETYAANGIDVVLFVTGVFGERSVEFYLVNSVTGGEEFIYKLTNIPSQSPVKMYVDLEQVRPLIKGALIDLLYPEDTD